MTHPSADDANGTVQKAYGILTARKVLRVRPIQPERIKELIRRSRDEHTPLVLTLVWLGVKTAGTGVADGADMMALKFIRQNIVEPLEKLGIKTTVKLLFADSNASYLEGYSRIRIDLYRNSLKKMAASAGSNFQFIDLNKQFWNNAFKLDGNETISLEELARHVAAESILRSSIKKAEKAARLPAFKTLELWASKHSLLVQKKAGSAENIAMRYIYFRIFALDLYHAKYPDELLLSFVKPDINEIIMPPPFICIFTVHRGFSECPWFIDEKNARLLKLKSHGV